MLLYFNVLSFQLIIILFSALQTEVCGPNCVAVGSACADECPPFYEQNSVTKV
jgi:hypothetical protein